MWTYNTDYNKWFANDDSISKNDFDYLKQELKATRYYSRILSGATYLPVNNLMDVYDILGNYQSRDWYISNTTTGSPYSVTSIPPQHATPIDQSTYDDYSKYLTEYGLTLKNLFTPHRLIKDASKNFYYVDVATTAQIDLTTITKNYVIDNVLLKEGHRVLVKDQTVNVVLLNTADPNTYFTSKYTIVQDLGATIEYQYSSEENGIYKYTNGNLVRETDLDVYEQCVRYSVSVKLGTVNANKQFHLSRLLNGYYPTTLLAQPIEFIERHNWILRNRVDYNNLFEINYYDIVKHDTQTYNYQGFTYSIPERIIAVGEFGIILNTQESKSNIIKNKYKVNLRSISQTSQYYWICGDENTLLRVRKHDFYIDRILLEEIPTTLPQLIITNLTSVSFYNDLVGVVVGELNTILYTRNGGETWERIEVDSFSEYNYNKVLYTTNSSFYVAGNVGVLIEFVDSIAGWTAYKRRISQIEDSVDEYLLVENINDMYKTNISTWGVSYSYYTQSIPTNKELLFLVTNNNKVIAYDINNSFSQIGTDFIYFDFGQDYSDIRNIKQKQGTNTFYFTGTDPVTTYDGIFSFDINSFGIIGTGSSYSNTAIGTNATFEYSGYPNQIFDYNATEMLICGNTSLLGYSTYSTLNFNSLDSTFEDKLKSKMLVIDYDIASKLNFFTDAGEYRLPNSITFSNDTLATVNSRIGFSPIQHNQTSTNGGTYSETNWLTYWTDTQKTFEYYTNTPLDESKKVLISTTFSYNLYPAEFTYSSSQVTGSASQMAYLAPSILYATHSRYFDQNTSITAPNSLTAAIFLYNYLMVYKVKNIYPINVGDVLKFESDIIDTEFVVNKIVTIGGFKYLYMATDFNQNIINDLQSTSGDIKIKNLNKYTTKAELKERFNSHPISNAYRLDYVDSYGNVTSATSSVFQLSARFNNITSYYNLQSSVTVAANTQIVPLVSLYQFSGGVSYSALTTGLTYSFTGGVSASSTISPVAGNGASGFAGDSGPAISAKLDGPVGISYDLFGNLYIADNLNSRIRIVDNSGVIDTIAGSSLTPGIYSGDTGPALSAGLENPIDVAVDMDSNIYIVGGTGSTNQVIRKIDALTSKIDVYAGSNLPPLYGAPGYNSAGENAVIFDTAVQFDNITGIHFSMIGLGGGPFGGPCLYVADCNNHLVRQIDITTSTIRTVAGDMSLTPGYSGDGYSATSAKLTNPYSVTTDSMGNLYIADSGNFVVRKVDITTGDISTVAGIGANGYLGDGGLATAATLGTVNGINIDATGDLHISSNDGVNKTIRVVNALTGKISTLTVLPSHAFKLTSSPIAPGIVFSVKGADVVQRHPLPETAATISGNLTFLPINNDVVLLKLNGVSTTFTFKTVPTLASDVLIAGTINSCLNNLKTKIEASTAYSTYLTYAEVVADTLYLTVKNGYGDIPNLNSNWNISFFNTTTTSEVNAILSGSMSSLPIDGNTATLTIDSNTTTYTFKNSPTPFTNEIQIGGSIISTLDNLLKGVTSSYSTYLSPTSSVIGDAINLTVKPGYGSIPNSNSNWKLTYNLTIGSSYVTTDYDMIYTSGFLKFGYSPTYNLMDYLTGLNSSNDVNPKFYATKEYLAMPQYEGLPLGSLTFSTVYIDYNGLTYSGGSMSLPTNKILFGAGLKLEWDSIFINTFVDVKVKGTYNYSTEKLLVMNKYYDSLKNAYVIEFHKRVLPISSLYQNILSGCTLDIISRRHLSQISDDLQELNNIQRTKSKSNSWQDQDLFKYDNYQNELNFKIPTDSYAKILLSDSDTVQQLSAIIYVDYKNELAMNITRLSKEYNVPILNTSSLSGTFSSVYYTDKLYISCSEKHDLVDGEGVVLEFNGGVGSSQELNPQYAGYHVITKINEYDFITNINYGNIPTTGSDSGYVRYTKQDPFLNYQPVDLIDLGIDGRGKMSLELSIENLKLSNSVYSLINVDFEKYRFRLVDGLNMDTVNLQYAWLLEAELSGAVIGLSNGELVWYKGTWLYGRWFGGIWQSGVWMAGDWYGGTWNANTISDKILTVDVDTKTVDFEQSFWYDGRWFGGTWNAGVWNNGRWYDGTWNNGMWHKGIWNDGTWNNGRFEGGIWVLGTWNSGVFNCNNEPTYWLDGEWYGGDFENGMWYNGTWEQRKGLSRFGTKSFNSRTANWQAGKWISGSFYSDINTDDNGVLIASEVNKYSIWKTGQWFSGEWYGGIAYNMDFKTGTWYGGILEDIEVIQIDTILNTFTLNGIFYFNTGDNIFIIDNLSNNSNSVFGSDDNPGSYIVLYASQDTLNQSTTVYVATDLAGSSISSSVDTGLRVVSKFTNLNWKGGIWTNGIYDSGLWEGGLWYNGVFNGTWH
jgi:hypothetical protein